MAGRRLNKKNDQAQHPAKWRNYSFVDPKDLRDAPVLAQTMVPGTKFVVSQDTGEVDSMMTVMPDGVHVNWKYCAACHHEVTDCRCSNGVLHPSSIEWIYIRTRMWQAGHTLSERVDATSMEVRQYGLHWYAPKYIAQPTVDPWKGTNKRVKKPLRKKGEQTAQSEQSKREYGDWRQKKADMGPTTAFGTPPPSRTPLRKAPSGPQKPRKPLPRSRDQGRPVSPPTGRTGASTPEFDLSKLDASAASSAKDLERQFEEHSKPLRKRKSDDTNKKNSGGKKKPLRKRKDG